MTTWTSKNLKKWPVSFTNGPIVNMDENSFIIAQQDTSERGSIWKYDIYSDNLQQIYKYPKSVMSFSHSIAYNPANNTIFLYPSKSTEIAIIDITLKRIKLVDFRYDNGRNYRPVLLCINRYLHLFGGSDNTKHLQWDYQLKQFKEVHNFVGLNMTECVVAYSKSKGIILCFASRYSQYKCQWFLEINMFKIYSNQWDKVNVDCPWMLTMGAVFTADGNYVIIAGVKNYDEGDDIYVLDMQDIDDVELRKSKIKCPKPGVHHFLKAGDVRRNELLVIGYIRETFASDEFKEMRQLSTEIMNLIVEWNYDEMIHWIEWNDEGEENEHYVIAVSAILSNLE